MCHIDHSFHINLFNLLTSNADISDVLLLDSSAMSYRDPQVFSSTSSPSPIPNKLITFPKRKNYFFIEKKRNKKYFLTISNASMRSFHADANFLICHSINSQVKEKLELLEKVGYLRQDTLYILIAINPASAPKELALAAKELGFAGPMLINNNNPHCTEDLYKKTIELMIAKQDELKREQALKVEIENQKKEKDEQRLFKLREERRKRNEKYENRNNNYSCTLP